MGRQFAMTWEGPPAFRWVKMYRGSRYRISCDELGVERTKEGSYVAANVWWAAKVAELAAPDPVTRTFQATLGSVPVDKLKELIERGQIARSILTALPLDEGKVDAAIVDAVIGIGPLENDQKRVEYLAKLGAKLGERVEIDHTLEHLAEKFLAVEQTDMKPLSYRELRLYIKNLYHLEGLLSAGMDVRQINEGLVEKVFLHLSKAALDATTKKKRWGFFRRLVRYLWEQRLIELPRNLTSLGFTATAKKIQTYDLAFVRSILTGLKPRFRLYALLGLNCGMTAADIGQLRKDQVDLNRKRLVRKRVKTGNNANVPEVDYLLWNETVELLRACMSSDPVIFLTSMDGTPLWESRYEGDATPQKDLIYQQFKRGKVPIPHKAFRSIGAAEIETHEHFGRYKIHFLGHSPKSIVDKHYAPPSPELFDQIMLWLRGRVFGS